MSAGEGLEEDGHRRDSDEQTEPAKATPVGAVPSVPGHPEICEGEQQSQSRRFDGFTIRPWAERQVHRHDKGQKPDENVDDSDLAIPHPAEKPYAVEA